MGDSKKESKEEEKPPEGWEGNLTKEQTEKLKEAWRCYFSVIGGETGVAGLEADKDAADDEDPKKKRGEGEDAFKDKSKDDKAKEKETTEREQKEAAALLGTYSKEELRKAFWDGSRGETPDALLLRFLRARKWDVNKAFAMAASVGRWRLQMDVEGIKRKGEEGLCKEYDSGKVAIHGTDLQDRPIVYIHVRKHRLGDQSQEALQRFTIFGIESAKSVLTPRCHGQGCIVFDLEGFGLMNMDWLCLRFLIEVFEARYPETLGVLLIHKAPLIALGIWRIVAPFLDPNVREKIVFTNSADDMAKYIDIKKIPVGMGGKLQWEWTYTGPVEGENSRMQEKKKVKEVMEQWEEAISKFEDLTKKWIDGDEEAGKERRTKGNNLVMIRYYDSDNYVRGQTVYSRTGTAVGDGRVHWKYPDHDEWFGRSYDEVRKEMGISGKCPQNGHKDGAVAAAKQALDSHQSADDAAAYATGLGGDDEDITKLQRLASNTISKFTPGPSNEEKARESSQKEHDRLQKEVDKAKEQEKKDKENEEREKEAARKKQKEREAEENKPSLLGAVTGPLAWAGSAVYSTAQATAAGAAAYVPAALGGDTLREYTGAGTTNENQTDKSAGTPQKKSKGAQDSKQRAARAPADVNTTEEVEENRPRRSHAISSKHIDTSSEASARVPSFDPDNVNYSQTREPPVHMFSDT